MSKANKRTVTVDQKVSQLVRLKKLERPDAEFWQRFDQEFRSRQLQSFVQVQPVHRRVRRLAVLVARKAAPSVAAAGAIALSLVAVNNASFLSDTPQENPTVVNREILANTADSNAYFLVEQTAPNDEDRLNAENESIPVLEFKGSDPLQYRISGYNLKTSPVTFTQESVESNPAIGAKVITVKPGY